MDTSAAEDVVAAELVAARQEGRSLARVPGCRPRQHGRGIPDPGAGDVAMAGLAGRLEDWLHRPGPAHGRGSGPVGRPHLGSAMSAWRRAPIPAEVGIFTSGFAAVEAELVIRLGQDLPAHDGGGWTAEEAAGPGAGAACRHRGGQQPGPGHQLARPDRNRRRFRQQQRSGARRGPCGLAEWSTGPACLLHRRETLGEGSAENLPGGIHHGLATALNILAGRGRPVGAGMVFATGAITGIHPIGPGQHCRVEVRGGPSVELRTVDARTSVSPEL